MKGSSERGPFGTWLRQARLARFPNVPTAIAAIQREAGYGIAPSVWAELESGTRRPSAEQRERLTRFFGSTPDESDQEPSGLILRALLEEVTKMREAQETIARELGAVAGYLAASATPAETRGGPDVRAPDGTRK